jgi:hypothetical protein
VRFDGKVKLEFHGARESSDGGLLAYRELDEALGLSGIPPDIRVVDTLNRSPWTRSSVSLRFTVTHYMAGHIGH